MLDMKNFLPLLGGLLLGLLLLPGMQTSAFAQDLVYRPANPAFGGSPANARWLRSSADAQNSFSGGSDFGVRDDPLENFERDLQRQVLNQLTRQIVGDRFGDRNIDLSEEGSFDFGRFSIDVRPGPSSIVLRIFNNQTGESSTVEVPRF